MINIIRSEMLKVRTTNVWWGMLIGVVAFSAVTSLGIFFATRGHLSEASPSDTESLRNFIYTSGQWGGTLLAMVLGALIVTNEFFHQTATHTFLANPQRSRVIAGKLVAALFWGAIYAAASLIVAVPVAVALFASNGVDSHITDPAVLRTIGMDVVSFSVWTLFGVGLGTLLKNQIAAVVVCVVLKLANQVASVILQFLSGWLEKDWISEIGHYLPSGASDVMTSTSSIPHPPAWWVGLLVMLAYGLLSGALGTTITIRRDIS